MERIYDQIADSMGRVAGGNYAAELASAFRLAVEQGHEVPRVFWKLAELRHRRDLGLYGPRMDRAGRKAIVTVINLCVLQAHVNVSPDTWKAAEQDAEVSSGGGTGNPLETALWSASWTAALTLPFDHSGSTWLKDSAYRSMYWSSKAAEKVVAADKKDEARREHYIWECTTLLHILENLTKK